MRMIKSITAMVAALTGMAAMAGDSAPFLLDTRTERAVKSSSIAITYDAAWIGGGSNSTVVIADNGVEIGRRTGAGEFEYALEGGCRHNLTYTTLMDDVAQEEVYSATVFKNWKYDVVDGTATITETSQDSGELVVPSEIDGYTVTGIGAGVFEGCSGLTSVTMPYRFRTQFGDTLNDCEITYIATVRFEAEEEEVLTRYVACGSAVGELAELESPVGYTLGLFTASDGGVAFSADTIVTEDVTLYARWAANEYEVTFDAAEGEISGGWGQPPSRMVVYDSTYMELPTVTRTGYTFGGWMLGDDVVISNTVVKTAENHTLVASWVANEYQVTFDAAGGVVETGDKTVTYDGVYGGLPTASCDGYVFLGWMLDGVDVGANTVVKTAENHTLVASWVANEYQVTFDAVGGVVVGGEGGGQGTDRPTKDVTFDGEYGELPTASCEGYVFLGWELHGVKVASNTVVKTAADHALTAKWGIRIGNGVWSATVSDAPIVLGAPLVPPTGDVVIPAEIAGRSVVGITAAAFAGNTAVTGVTIPASVGAIANGALGAIPATVIVTDDDLDIPDAVKGNVRKVVFADGVTRVEDNYFEGCANLEAFDLAESVVKIGTNVFEAVSALETVTTNGLVLYQGWCLGFAGESTGGTPVAPVNGQDARYPSIPGGVRGIAAGAFEGEYGIETVVFPSTLRFVGAGAFRDCTGLVGVDLPEGVVSVDREAFRSCTYAQELSLPGTLKEIGAGAFANCTMLMGVTCPDGLADIGECAFSNCWRMLSAMVPASVTNVGAGAFADCRRLTDVTVPFVVGTMAELFPAAYDKITSVWVAVDSDGTEPVPPMPDGMFAGCAAMNSLSLPEGLAAVSEAAFVGCVSMVTFDLPNTVTNIGARAFAGLPVTEAVVPSGVATLGEEVFAGCTNLSSVALPNGLTELSDRLFANCSSLTTIVVPESVATLGASVFDGCGALASVCYVGNAPAYDPAAYEGVPVPLVTKVVNGSMGWDGIATSKALPEFWPAGTTQEITFWEPNRFMVDFVVTDGEGTVATQRIEQVTDTTYALPDDPIRRGATFGGWWTAAEGGVRVTAVTPVDQAPAYTLYARWAMNRYTVRFDANGGVGEAEPVEMTVAARTTLPACGFSRVDYAFVGWAMEPDGAVAYADAVEVVDLAYEQGASVTLYAVWEERKWTTGDAVGADAESVSLPWESDGEGPNWTIDYETIHDGVASVRSGTIGAAVEEGGRTVSTLRTSVTGEGRGAFWWKVSCEEMDENYGEWYDYAVFAIDGVEIAKIAGDSGWTQVVYAVSGAGTHTLAWTFTRDDYDEDGAAWANAAWVDEFVWTPAPVTVTFDAGGAAEGEAPEAVTKHAGYALTLPGAGTLANGALVFMGWSDGVTTYAAGTAYAFPSVDVTLTAVWELKTWTLGEAVDAETLTFTTGGDSDWAGDATAGWTNGVSAKSGKVENGQSSWIELSVSGAGTLTFTWNVMGGIYRNNPFAYAKVEVDGVQQVQEYTTGGWKDESLTIEGAGTHTVRWTYLRTSSRTAEGDCAWLDGLAWTPAGGNVETVVDVGGGKSVTVPGTWLEEHSALVEAAGGDASAALAATAANGRKVWECYALGLDPGDNSATNDFKITSFPLKADGTPDIEHIVFEPPQAKWNVPATYKVKGAAELSGPWQEVGGGLGETALPGDFRFFKVEVVLP